MDKVFIEKDLLERVANGDEAAFNVLFQQYHTRLHRYLLVITKSDVIAEELVIDIFMKLWIGRELLNRILHLDAFLHKVAYNKAIDYLKDAARRVKLQDVYFRQQNQSVVPGADELLISEELRRIVREAINQLPPQRRRIYLMSREDGLTHDQIADVLNLSANTVKNTITLSTKSIYKFLKSRQKDDLPGTLLLFLIC